MSQLLAYGSYLPFHRLEHRRIAEALGVGGGRGARAVASFDEDTTTMGVEAARRAMWRGLPSPTTVYFSTAAPAYLDKTNANVIHAALGLDGSALAVDFGGAVRSGVGAFLAAAHAPGTALAVLSDVRTGLPGGADEREGGDAAAAFLFGPGPGIAEVLAFASSTQEFLDRWRLPSAMSARVWEERFGEQVYLPLAHAALSAALKDAGLTPDDVRHAFVAGTHKRAVVRFTRESGFGPDALAGDLTAQVGNSGTAQFGVQLADVLDRAEPGDVVAASLLADGATTIILRVGNDRARQPISVRDEVAAGSYDLSYATYLTWRGLLDREPPRRPDPDPPAAPPSQRNERWKYRLTASTCLSCGQRHLPPARTCVACGERDRMGEVAMCDVAATVTTFTVDHLAFSPSPPLVAVVLDFDGGGRLRCQLTDADASSLAVGDRVRMTFRRLGTARGIHNYFWKARPVSSAKGVSDG